MNESVSRSNRQTMTQTFLCDCCGRRVVLLRRWDWTPGKRRWVKCYARGWDGSPWYVPGGLVMRHPPRWTALHFRKIEDERKKQKDPLASLD